MNIPDNFYRVSIKWIILNEKHEFLLIKEDNGKWELPGGGLDFWELPYDWLKREIREEMWLEVTFISPEPFCFFTFLTSQWRINICYLIKVENLEFTPSDECIEIWFFDKQTSLELDLYENVKIFATDYSHKLYSHA